VVVDAEAAVVEVAIVVATTKKVALKVHVAPKVKADADAAVNQLTYII
jgi:hypothetical protein